MIDVWKVAADELTEKQLTVYSLKHRRKLSLRQIALATGASVSTVRTHLEAAERKMARALGGLAA